MARRRTSRSPKRTSRKPTKRTSRGLRANVIPPPPFGHIDVGHWAKRTFAVGTPVRLRMPWDFRSGQDGFPRVFPAGTRAEVVDLESTGLTIRTKVVSPLLLSAEREGFYADVYYSSVAQVLEPLVDNWGDPPSPSKRTSLPKTQRGLSMKHRRLLPNGSEHSVFAKFKGTAERDPALSEPEKDSLAKLIESEAPIDWTIDSEFSNDEPVHVSAWALFDSASKAMRFMAKVREWAEDYRVPVEVKSKSYKDDAEPAMKVVTVDDLLPRTPRLADPEREASIAKSMQIADDVLDEMIASGELDEEMLERPQPPPRVESARGRLSLVKKPKKPRPNARRTSRRMRPNATCPSCGSPHYFESMWHRDCATPECRYFRGGTIGGQPEEETEEPSVRLTGSRRLGLTTETVYASEPDVYPEIEGEQLDDIVIEADDLDEDETFAERAAKIIAEELGHVEGSEYPGPSRWYTQSDADEDYSTGDSTRRSIHIDDAAWTEEEKREIYDELKRRRLL
jgi:hypothetical protein